MLLNPINPVILGTTGIGGALILGKGIMDYANSKTKRNIAIVEMVTGVTLLTFASLNGIHHYSKIQSMNQGNVNNNLEIEAIKQKLASRPPLSTDQKVVGALLTVVAIFGMMTLGISAV